MPISWKMARTATGSTAEMSAENTKQSVGCNVYSGSANDVVLIPSEMWTAPIHPTVTKPIKDSPKKR